MFRNLVPYFLMSSASGYMGEKYFQNLVPEFWTCPTAKKGHICKGLWISVVRQIFTGGGVIIMKSQVVAKDRGYG